MGKKGSWFSAIKRVFTHNSEGSNKKSGKEKKKGQGTFRHGETKSFIPLFRKPSSIEKILGEADELLIRPPTSFDPQITPPAIPERPASPRANSPKSASRRARSPRAVTPRAASPRATSPRAASPKATSPRAASPKAASSKGPTHPKINQKQKEIKNVHRPEPTLRNQHLFATKIQAVYRGYLARRSFRALRGLVRLQGVVRGQNVRRQTMNAMKQMQLLVRVQSQIQTRRIQMLENQALQHQAYRNDKEVESTLSKWMSNQSEAGNHEDWDDSLLTKEEVEARLRKKVEAVIKRERAMAYAYSQQLWKANPKLAQTSLDNRSNGFPWWWNWLEQKLPLENSSQSQNAAKTVALTPPRPISEYKPSPRLHSRNYKHNNFGFNNHESSSPRSSRSAIPVRAKQYRTPSRTPPPAKTLPRTRASPANSAYNVPLKDDDSLMSCPPFSVPNYMAPTVSAKAKVRANSNPKERIPSTPGSDSKRRFSFPLTPNIGSFKWNKGSNNDTTSQKVLEKHQSVASIGDLSIDSAVSMPATAGRKPFNRFV
ncbi:IQ-DOMAIN 14 [Olea europaea subsp. europaea]|uniref:IQ-DOMAIN 14 n=1 Tax=Olea europaea subsp. europaea TaxID=158383 RepID=A0A8S0RN17_OLEEU|nr:IQ-DOMAIN 14 [Olea europaea subsp. europaea]